MKKILLFIALLATGVGAAATAYSLIGRRARTVDVVTLFATGMAFGSTLMLTVQRIRQRP